MNSTNKSKILVALDGSDWSFETVRYVSGLEPFKEKHIVLYHVFDPILESYWDIEKVPEYARKLASARAWEQKRRNFIENFMMQAQSLLLDSGFPEDSITTKIEQRKAGIARDILQEARNGYTALVIGRKGTGKIKELILGTLVRNLIQCIDTIPLLIVGKCPGTKKVLIAIDGSDYLMRAVSYVGEMLNNCDCEVTLVHVVRSDSKQFIDQAQKRIKPFFDMAKSHLLSWGFDPQKIDSKVITGALTRAGAIIEKARQEGFCTIVVGRKGVSNVPSFPIGRVSSKVAELAKEQVVWIVS